MFIQLNVIIVINRTLSCQYLSYTLIIFKNGKEEKRLVGLRDKEELLNLF